MKKPSPVEYEFLDPSILHQKFWDVFGELFSTGAADILDPDEDCPFQVSVIVYPDKTSTLINKCGQNMGKGGKHG